MAKYLTKQTIVYFFSNQINLLPSGYTNITTQGAICILSHIYFIAASTRVMHELIVVKHGRFGRFLKVIVLDLFSFMGYQE